WEEGFEPAAGRIVETSKPWTCVAQLEFPHVHAAAGTDTADPAVCPGRRPSADSDLHRHCSCVGHGRGDLAVQPAGRAAASGRHASPAGGGSDSAFGLEA